MGPAALGALDAAVTDGGAETPRTTQLREGRPEELPLRNPCLARGAQRPECAETRAAWQLWLQKHPWVAWHPAPGHRGLWDASPSPGFSAQGPTPTRAAPRPGSLAQGEPLLGRRLRSRSPIYEAGTPRPTGCPRDRRGRGGRTAQPRGASEPHEGHGTRHYFTLTRCAESRHSHFPKVSPLSAGSVHVAGRSTQSQHPSRSVRAGRLQPAAGASQGSRTTLGTTKDRSGWGPRGGRRGDAADSGMEALSLAKLEPSPPGRQTPRHCSPIAVLNT